MENYTIIYQTPEKQIRETEVQAHGAVQAERKFYLKPEHEDATVKEISKDNQPIGERW